MPHSLVIVESPAKARTIAGFLGDGYVVESSVGHIRDLPSNASEIPKAYAAEKWSRLGVDVDNDFKPLYVVTGRAKKQVARLKSLLRDDDVEALYLATDEDREGEAIAWHLLEVLNPQVPVHRMVFHEITAQAIAEAIESPRELDRRLVDAQEARRIFDRLYGYEVSPVLWRKVQPKLSAGRVQSVANRLIVERERERMAFAAASFWSLTVTLDSGGAFETRLAEIDGARVAASRDFDDAGALAAKGAQPVVVLDEARAGELSAAVVGRSFEVSAREAKPYRRRPAAPFITSTLQQAAGGRHGFSAARTMAAAQRLYEAGRITYMRTDATTLSSAAQHAARAVASAEFGAETVPAKPRAYTRKTKNAQEAHEAIRPAGETWRRPGTVSDLGGDAARVYDLVWQRTVASQMNDAVGETVSIRLTGTVAAGNPVGETRLGLFTAGTVVTAPGWRFVYGAGDSAGDPTGDPTGDSAADPSSSANGAGDPAADSAADSAADPAGDSAADPPEQQLPDLAEGDTAQARSATPRGHETSPPSRYTEASLVRRLEQLGVGRPSTYASIMETIQNRGYVWKKSSALVPTWTSFVTVALMEKHYDRLVDYELTARMEDDLDDIAAGEKQYIPWLADFYFGAPAAGTAAPNPGLRHLVSDEFLEQIDPAALNNIPLGNDADGEPVVVRLGRFGPYLRRGDDTRSLPPDVAPDELTVDRAVELLSAPAERALGTHPETGEEVIVLPGRFGPYVSAGRRTDDGPKPKTASLLESMSPETVTLDDALKLLSLPRTVGTDDDDVPITVQSGRYGPYLVRGKDSRNLESEEQLFTIDREQALALLAQPKRARSRRSQEPLRELGNDPVSGRPVVLKDGRFGLYVTDGDVNASLRQDDEGESITIERAAELLEMRRAAPARAARKPAAKKPAKKKPAKKAPAKKTPAKKTPAKKAPAK